jgi:hypothetical protein
LDKQADSPQSPLIHPCIINFFPTRSKKKKKKKGKSRVNHIIMPPHAVVPLEKENEMRKKETAEPIFHRRRLRLLAFPMFVIADDDEEECREERKPSSRLYGEGKGKGRKRKGGRGWDYLRNHACCALAPSRSAMQEKTPH